MGDLSLSKMVQHLQENKAKILRVKESTKNLQFLTYTSYVILAIVILYALFVKRNTTYLPNPATLISYVPSIPQTSPQTSTVELFVRRPLMMQNSATLWAETAQQNVNKDSRQICQIHRK